MRPDTILVPTGCDLKRLPLDASEVFLLSRLDGQLTLEEISEISGMEFDKARRLAERLVILGVAKPKGDGSLNADAAMDGAPRRRVDPRAEETSIRPPRVERVETIEAPKSRRVPSMRPARAASLRPPKLASVRPGGSSPVTPEPKRRKSSRSLKAQRAAEEVCEIDEPTQQKIKELDGKLKTATFYELLGVARDADKKEIKRAYFALAAVFHPDRFFGKKLGPMRPVLDRVFVRITEANDTLGSRQRREAYDAMLPPMPAPVPKFEPPKIEEPSPKKPSKTMPAPRKMSKRLRRSQMMAAANAAAANLTAPVITEKPVDPAVEREKFQRLQATAKLIAGQTRADALAKAGDEALRTGDIIGAANNYRLALQMHDDPTIKDKLAAVDRHSRDLRYEKYLAKARAAERAERWDEAADHYLRANEARKEGSVAERAANALRMAKGDLRQATALAEQAVEENGKIAEYRVTLGEVLLAAKLLVRAKEECDHALKLAPSNPRAQLLASALKKS